MVKGSGIKIVLICLLLQAVVTLVCQLQFTYLLGTDAYYLVVQAQSVLSTGSLKIPDGDPIPFFMAGIMRMGASGEESFRILMTITQGCTIGILVKLLLDLGWGRYTILGLLALVVGESIGLYHVFEFPKLSLALLILFVALAVYRGTILSKILSIGLLMGASLIHPAVWPVVALCLGFLVHSDGRLGRYRTLIYVTAAGVIVLSASYFLLRHGNGILERYTEASGGPGIVVFLGRDNIPRFLQVEVAFVLVLIVVALCISLVKRKYAEATTYGSLLLLTLLPTSADEMFGLGERMVLVVAIAALPIAIMIVIRTSDGGPTEYAPMKSGFMVIATLCGAALWAPSLFADALATVDYSRLKTIVEYVGSRKPEMLIAQRSLSFYYTAFTGSDAFMFDPDPNWDKTKTWRVAFDVDVNEILYFAPTYCSTEPGLIGSIGGADAVLVREDCWEAFRQRVPREDLPGLWGRVWNNQENPSKLRPIFLKARYLPGPL